MTNLFLRDKRKEPFLRYALGNEYSIVIGRWDKKMSTVLFKNGEVFYQGKIQKKDVLIENEYIVAIEDTITDDQAKVIDIQNQLLTLGFVDMHVHLREPGAEYKETIDTGTRSAKYGGYTHIVAMANTYPCMDSEETIQDFSNRVKRDGRVHTYTYSAITKGLQGKTLVDFDTLSKQPVVIGFSDDGRGVQDSKMMASAMKKAKQNQTMIVAHCEDEMELQPGACIHAGTYAKDNKLVGINSDSEWKHAKRDLSLVEEIKCRYHICHISTKETVAALKETKAKGLLVSGEVCPHHLILTDENIMDCHPNYKMNPPLRSKEDLEALLAGLRDGIVSVIATDHAPHSREEKAQSIEKAPFGIIGVQHAFSLVHTYLVRKNLLPLETVLTCMADNPAQVLGLDHHFEVGKKANLCVIDLEEEFVITEESIKSKSINTPFLDVACTGKVTYHILDGVVTKL